MLQQQYDFTLHVLVEASGGLMQPDVLHGLAQRTQAQPAEIAMDTRQLQNVVQTAPEFVKLIMPTIPLIIQ